MSLSLADRPEVVGRRFKPTEEFWSYLAKVNKTVTLVEISDHPALVVEAQARGLNVIAIAPQKAVDHPWSKYVWPLICRPPTTACSPQTLINARRGGASAIYVGVKTRFHKDLGSSQMGKHIMGKMGEEGERLYFIHHTYADINFKR